jgi:hypothetical protein
MTTNDILTLANAGFNSKQIIAIGQMMVAPTVPAQQQIIAGTQQTVPAQQFVPVQQTVPAQQFVPVQQTVPAQQAVPAQNADPVIAEIQKLTGAIQANALLNSNMPHTQQTADDILASIINPPTPDKK